MMRDLFESVRISGKILMKEEPFMRDRLPFVYTGDSDGGVEYWNSGGRSVLVENSGHAYKINGVDPYGYLTKKVATSGKNHTPDVSRANRKFESQRGSEVKKFYGKPFGVYTYENVEMAKTAFDILNENYGFSGIQPPCEFTAYSRIDEIGNDAYQILFSLPELESDLRLNEFISVLSRKLSSSNRDEIRDKLFYIKRLFGRFVGWTGYTFGIMSMNGLVPTKASWVPQNYVLHRLDNGYGIFRVDHTSTECTRNDRSDINLWIQSYLEGNETDFPAFQFSFIPEAAEIAANHPKVTDDLPVDKRLSPFDRVIAYYVAEAGKPKKSIMNMGSLMEAHKIAFSLGFQSSAIQGQIKDLSIPEEYFRKILE